MLLLALQTTTSAVDDSTIDAVTLVLVVIFIASMAALSIFLRRNEKGPEPDREVPPPPLSSPPPSLPVAPSPNPDRQPLPANSARPVWLDGVTFPTADASLAAAAAVIEELFAARRENDLRRGLALYMPESLRSLRASLGVDDADLERAEFTASPPALRSIEVLSATGNRMTVRAGYATGSPEIYRLVRLDDRWLIEEISASR